MGRCNSLSGVKGLDINQCGKKKKFKISSVSLDHHPFPDLSTFYLGQHHHSTEPVVYPLTVDNQQPFPHFL